MDKNHPLKHIEEERIDKIMESLRIDKDIPYPYPQNDVYPPYPLANEWVAATGGPTDLRHHKFPAELPFTQMAFADKLRDIFGDLYYRTEGKDRRVKLGLDEEAYRNFQKFLEEDYLKSGMIIYDDTFLDKDVSSYEFRRNVREKGRFDVYLIDKNDTNGQ